jgi:hypothetical protein
MNDKDIKVLEELKISLSKNLERLNDSDISTTMFNIFSLRKQQAQAIENLLKENEELRKQINGAFDRGFIPVAKIEEEYLNMEKEYARKVYDKKYNRKEVKLEEMYKSQVYKKLLEGK